MTNFHVFAWHPFQSFLTIWQEFCTSFPMNSFFSTMIIGYAFKPNRRSIVAIYDENGKSKIMVIDAGDSYISTLLSNVK